MFVASKQSILALGGGAFKLSARDRSIDGWPASQPMDPHQGGSANGLYSVVHTVVETL